MLPSAWIGLSARRIVGIGPYNQSPVEAMLYLEEKGEADKLFCDEGGELRQESGYELLCQISVFDSEGDFFWAEAFRCA